MTGFLSEEYRAKRQAGVGFEEGKGPQGPPALPSSKQFHAAANKPTSMGDGDSRPYHHLRFGCFGLFSLILLA
jgi:hypothetical protein